MQTSPGGGIQRETSFSSSSIKTGQLSNCQDWLNYSFLKPVMKLLRVVLRKHLEQYLSVCQNIFTEVLGEKHFDAGSIFMRRANIFGLMLLRLCDE